MTSHLSDDVIGLICSGYVPFNTVLGLSSTADSETRLRDWKNPSDIGFPSNIHCELIAPEKKLPSAGIEPRSPMEKFLRRERSSTLLAGPGAFTI